MLNLFKRRLLARLPVSDMQTILIVRPDALGDVVLTFPLLHALHLEYPLAKIYYLAAAYTRPLIEMHPDVAGVIVDPLEKGTKWSHLLFLRTILRAYQFSAVFHCYNEVPYAMATWLAGIPIRVGDASKISPRIFHTHGINQGYRNLLNHEVDLNMRYLDAVAIPRPKHSSFGFTAQVNYLPKILQQVDKTEKWIVIHPGSGGGNRTWSVAFYKTFIASINKDYQLVFTGGIAEKERNAEICLGISNSIDLTGQTDLLQLAAVISGAICFVGVDTGPMHVAAALGIPVVLISPTKYVKPNRWGPYGVINRVVAPKKVCNKRCFPYTCKNRQCIDAILPENVVQAFHEVLMSKYENINQNKREWLKVSVNLLNLSKDDIAETEWDGFNLYQLKIEDGNLRQFIITHDINVVLISYQPGFHEWWLRNSVAPYIYCPPIFIQYSTSRSLSDQIIEGFESLNGKALF